MNNILILTSGSIGDNIVAIPAINSIRRFYSFDRIFLLHNLSSGHDLSADIILSKFSYIDNFIGFRVRGNFINKLYSLFILIINLRRYKFEIVISLMPSYRSKLQLLRDKFIFRLSGIKSIVGFEFIDKRICFPERINGFLPHVSHEAEFKLNRLKNYGIDISNEAELHKPFLHIDRDLKIWASSWFESKFMSTKKLVCICPGSKQFTNLWPVENFRDLGQRLLDTGLFEITVIGGPAELQKGDYLISSWGCGFNAAGMWSLEQSASVLGISEFVIGLDTGTTHLAAAQGAKCIAIYGAREHPGRFYPLGSESISVIRKAVLCEGCYIPEGSYCNVKGHPCMSGISVDMVWKIIERDYLASA